MTAERGDMALSDYEKQVLEEMEQHLRAQDPKLADKMASAIPPQSSPNNAKKAALSPRRIALGSILAVLGLTIVLAGVSLGFSILTVVLGALGFLMMVGGVLLALSTDKNHAKPGSPQAPAGQQEARKTSEQKRQQRRERWNNREQG